MIRVKNWTKFQHFKNRRPPWIRLYRDLLNDREWNELTDQDARLLMELWLIASESKDKDGSLPPIHDISWRLRKDEECIKSSLSRLSHWIILDGDSVISPCQQVVAPEKRREETEKNILPSSKPTESDPKGFEEFWRHYPKKVGKGAVLAWWKRNRPDVALLGQMIRAIVTAKKSDQWMRDGGQYIPHPTTWLNQQRWLDEVKPAAQEPDPDRERKMKEAEERLKRLAEETHKKRVASGAP